MLYWIFHLKSIHFSISGMLAANESHTVANYISIDIAQLLLGVLHWPLLLASLKQHP